MQTLEDFLAEHAISEEVGGHGRYVRYEKGEDISSYVAGWDDHRMQWQYRSVSGQADGLVIVREGWGSPSPPQLRPDPDAAVYTSNSRKISFHPSDGRRFGFHRTQKGDWIEVRALRGEPLGRHLKKWHPDGNVEGVHFHRRPAKYVLPLGSHGKRLDVPARALSVMPDAEIIFFVIEGSLKTDAILSRIIETGIRASVFGVPSVSLWDAPELAAFVEAMNLGEKKLVIVPDTDWVTNPLVIAQAMLCTTWLRDRGISAYVAAPPHAGAVLDDDGDPKKCDYSPIPRANPSGYCPQCGGFFKGVDDFLAAGGDLDGLSVLLRDVPRGDPRRLWALNPHVRYINGLLRSTRALHILPLFANRKGELFKSVQGFARILGCSRDAARKAIADLHRARVIEVEGSLDAGLTYPQREPQHDWDWYVRPRITISHEFRAVELPMPLRELRNPRQLQERDWMKEAIDRAGSSV